MHLEVDDLRQGYVEVIDAVLSKGRKRAPRGMNTYEVPAATVVIHDVTKVLPVGVGRNPRIEIGAAEALQLIGGFSDPGMLISITKTFESFLTGTVLHGAYGPRIRPQLPDAERRLRQDTDTRQAWMQIWDPAYDRDDHPDMPCTTALSFEIFDGKLACHSTMRSNDALLGLTYDAFQFVQLQMTVANVLGLEYGPLYHNAKSLHIYERYLPTVEKLHAYDGTEYDEPTGLGHQFETVREAQERAYFLWGAPDTWETFSERWYADLLRDHVPSGR